MQKKLRGLLTQMFRFLNFTSFTYKENQVSNEEDNPSQKVEDVEEDID